MSTDKPRPIDSQSPSKEAIREEQKKINGSGLLVDLTMSVIMQSDLPLTEAQEMVEGLKKSVVSLFPGKDGYLRADLPPAVQPGHHGKVPAPLRYRPGKASLSSRPVKERRQYPFS